MNFTARLLAAIMPGVLTLPAFAAKHVPTQLSAPVFENIAATTPSRAKMQARPLEYPADVAADYDCCYYWLENNGTISNTWETSITEIVKGNADGEYIIKGLFADTFRPEGDNTFTTDDVKATYSQSDGTFTIKCGQPLFIYDNAGTPIQISLLGIRSGTAGWEITPEGTLTMLRTERGFGVASSSDLAGFYIGNYDEGTGRKSGFGAALYPEFHEFNGVMLYMVTPDADVEMMPYMCDVYTEVLDGTLTISNFADFGYDTSVALEYNLTDNTAVAYNARLGNMLDTEGNATPYYAATCATDGGPLTDAANNYVLHTTITQDKQGNHVLQAPTWAAYIDTRWIAQYGYTHVMLFMTLPDPAGIGDVTADDTTAPTVYYNLQGMPVEHPEPGNIYIRVQGSKSKKVLYRE